MEVHRRKVLFTLLAAAVCLVTLAVGLIVANGLAPRGVVYGSVHRCNWGCTSRIEPLPAARLQFVRTSDNASFAALADANGNYSVSLPAGHYRFAAFADAGPGQFDIRAGEKLEADYQVWALPQ
jgi:hypothetical protein